jgi:hypothetical protein
MEAIGRFDLIWPINASDAVMSERLNPERRYVNAGDRRDPGDTP